MSEETLVHRVGPKRLALFMAAGGAMVLASTTLFLDAGSLVYYLVLAMVPVDLVLAYVVLSRTFEKQLEA
ncbi:hypothetical protein [Haloarchaeobius sp. HME9146]|uniref:hypothetical protein n=1 Tax=Haloarchaeobius sp. HME9146 TaxID=2978732 RepID=UPI0021C00AAA|nr:hypothetical protein [Haloarchaeobius sp. HME9146]MCT9094477.1 hypothetical protein [Haloarchaeobius sp. HME9146]